MTGMTEYIYDAEGRRVAEGSISAWSCDTATNGFTVTADYVRDQAGNQLSEFTPGQNGTMVWQHTNVYANGELIATEDNTEAHFYMNDWLGTRRVQTNYLGVPEQTCSSLPYGDGESCAPTPTENLFTGKERDAESGNDYFGARYYASTMARWLSPDYTGDGSDPFPVPSADFDNPQSLNLYGYVHNNPLTNADPDGHDCVVQTRTSDTTENVSVSTGTCENVNIGDGQTKTYIAGTVDMSSIQSDGAGGISVGYTPYSGGGGVADLNAAPVPDRPGLAYNWGNNAQGYQTLGAANKTVTDATIGATIAYGGVGAAIVGGEIAAGTAALRSGIIFRLAHGMRIAMGHSQVLAEEGAIKNAIATAISSGAIQKMGGSAFQGVVQVAGTFIRFTGAFTPNGVIVSNVMGQALQK